MFSLSLSIYIYRIMPFAKATVMLSARAWPWPVHQCSPFGFTVAVEYMRGAVATSATRTSRFVEAVGFAQHVFGMDTDRAPMPHVKGHPCPCSPYARRARLRWGVVRAWEVDVVCAASTPDATGYDNPVGGGV